MTRSTTRRNVVTCWCESKSAIYNSVRCVICSKQFHIDCHLNLINDKDSWKCYLCHSEDTCKKSVSLKPAQVRCVVCSKQFQIDCHQSLIHDKDMWRCDLCLSKNAFTKVKEFLETDQFIESSSHDVQTNPLCTVRITSDASPSRRKHICKKSKGCQTGTKSGAKSKKSIARKEKIAIRVKKRLTFPEKSPISSASLNSRTDVKTESSINGTPISAPLESLSPGDQWILISKRNSKQDQNQLCSNKNSRSDVTENSSAEEEPFMLQREFTEPINQTQHDSNQAGEDVVCNNAEISALQRNAKRNQSERQDLDRPNSNKKCCAITASTASTGSNREGGVPGRMRIAQSSMKTNQPETTEWNDFGPGLLCLLCEDGCSVHLVFKVSGDSVLKIPVRPEPQNPPIVRFEFPSLIIAISCSESIWTKHAFTFLQSEICPELESILSVIHRVWSADALPVNFQNDPQEHLINYIKVLQNRPEFQAYCDAVQAAIGSQALFQ